MEFSAKHSKLSQFLLKLQTFVRNVPVNVGTWNEDGTVFLIKEHRFESEYLPAYFNCSRPSFIRQLHLYGFQKQATVGDCWSFSHVKFRRDSLHLMNEIQRKKQKRMKNEVVSMSKGRISIENLRSELIFVQQRAATLEKRIEELNQRDCNAEISVESGTSQSCERLIKAEFDRFSMLSEYHEVFSREIATVELTSAGNSTKTTIKIFGKFLEHFVAECQKSTLGIQNIQLPIGHPFEALLAHCDSGTMQAALVRALSYSELVSLNETCEPSLLIELIPSHQDFFNAIMIQTMNISGNIISQATGGIFSHFLLLLMRASITRQTNGRPVEYSKSPMLSGISLVVHQDAMERISCARKELEDYNTMTRRYHHRVDQEWICL